jgi:tetratricopeptide (TPR) repeat protein
MSEINLSSLDPRYGAHIDKAVRAIENGNPTYAIDVCSAFLHKHPKCLEVRKILRMAHHRLPKSRRGIIPKINSTFFYLIKRLRGWFLLKHPERAMSLAEELLRSNPHDIIAYRFLARAALCMELFETAIFAYESINTQIPDDKRNLLDLGNTYFMGKHYEEALSIGTQLLKINPSDGEAKLLLKRASVAHSIEKGVGKMT